MTAKEARKLADKARDLYAMLDQRQFAKALPSLCEMYVTVGKQEMIEEIKEWNKKRKVKK